MCFAFGLSSCLGLTEGPFIFYELGGGYLVRSGERKQLAL